MMARSPLTSLVRRACSPMHPSFGRRNRKQWQYSVEAYLEAGWTDVQVLERGAYFHKWDPCGPATHAQNAGRSMSKSAMMAALSSMRVMSLKAEARKLDRAAQGEDDTPTEIRPEMSGPMAQYIALHRHGATRATLVGSPCYSTSFDARSRHDRLSALEQ